MWLYSFEACTCMLLRRTPKDSRHGQQMTYASTASVSVPFVKRRVKGCRKLPAMFRRQLWRITGISGVSANSKCNPQPEGYILGQSCNLVVLPKQDCFLLVYHVQANCSLLWCYPWRRACWLLEPCCTAPRSAPRPSDPLSFALPSL